MRRPPLLSHPSVCTPSCSLPGSETQSNFKGYRWNALFPALTDFATQVATYRTTEELPMKTYLGSEIRNVAVVGHAHCGKTTLISALLHAAKMTPTQGRVPDGTAVTAYD